MPQRTRLKAMEKPKSQSRKIVISMQVLSESIPRAWIGLLVLILHRHCVGGSSTAEETERSCERVDRDYNIRLRVGLLFAILVTSSIGKLPSLVSQRKESGSYMMT